MENALVALDIVVTAFLGGVGLYLANNFRHQVKLKTAEGRTASYAALYDIMYVTSPVRLETYYEGPLGSVFTKEERMELHEAFTKWYFANGNGLFLSERTRRLYYAAKHNLICEPENLRLCDALGKRLDSSEFPEVNRGVLSIRQLSLLRSSMRADLEVYGPIYIRELTKDDEAFLRCCGEDPGKPPWNRKMVPNPASLGN